MTRRLIPKRDLPVRNLALMRFIDEHAGSSALFAKTIGVSGQAVTRYFSRDKRSNAYPSVSPNIIKKAARAYNMPASWLDDCETRIVGAHEDIQAAEVISVDSPTDMRPRMEVYALAGKLTEEIEPFSSPQPRVFQFGEYDFTIKIDGDSMSPTLRSGDEIAVKDVTRSGDIRGGEIYLLNTKSGPVVKRITDGDGEVLCVSDNTEYKPFTVRKSEILGIYHAVGMLRNL